MKTLTLDANERAALRAILDDPAVDPPHFSTAADQFGNGAVRPMPVTEWLHVDGDLEACGVTVRATGRRNPFDEVEAPTGVVLAAVDALDLGHGPPEAPPGVLVSLAAKLRAAVAGGGGGATLDAGPSAARKEPSK